MSRSAPSPRLAHGWRLRRAGSISPALLAGFVRPALRAVPRAAAARLKRCVIELPEDLCGAASQWTATPDATEIAVAAGGVDDHDIAMELLVCIGQAIWHSAAPFERAAWLKLLGSEIQAGVTGEMDDQALDAKRKLFAGRSAARDAELLAAYAEASFAATFAEYAHSMWHDVSIRSGTSHLDAGQVSRRLQWMARHFPPNRGYRLFAPP
jgi:hypothetical protein